MVSSATLHNEHLTELKKNFEAKLELPIDSFEVEKEIDDKVYLFGDRENLIGYNELIKYFNIPQDPNIPEAEPAIIVKVAETIPTARELKFLIHHFEVGKDNILIFTRQDRIALSDKKSIYKIFKDSDFEKVDDKDYYMFNPYVTCVFINDEVYVVDYRGFIEIFNYKNHLKKHVEDVIGLLESSGIVTNITHYKEEVSHYRHFNALTKVKNDEKHIKNYVKENNEKIFNISQDYPVNFKFNSKENSFDIDSEDGLKLVIRILSDRAGFDFRDDLITYATKESIKKNKA